MGVLIWVTAFWLYGLQRANRLHNIGGDPQILWTAMIGITFTMVYLCAIVMGFVTGASNVGGDFARGSAEFLLTRPRSRRHFVWAGWSAGIAEVLALMLATGLVVWGATFFILGAVWRQVTSPIRFQVEQSTIDIPMMVAAAFLTAALVFGLTYFMGVLLKSSQRGLIASLGILAGYQGLNAILRETARLSLPTLDFLERANLAARWDGSQRAQFIGWLLLVLAFPFAAQLALHRKEI